MIKIWVQFYLLSILLVSISTYADTVNHIKAMVENNFPNFNNYTKTKIVNILNNEGLVFVNKESKCVIFVDRLENVIELYHKGSWIRITPFNNKIIDEKIHYTKNIAPKENSSSWNQFSFVYNISTGKGRAAEYNNDGIYIDYCKNADRIEYQQTEE